MSGYRSNLDITGNVYGRLTVLGYDHSAKHKSYWRCRCERGSYDVYYDFTTRRDEALEASSWPFRFHPLEEGQS